MTESDFSAGSNVLEWGVHLTSSTLSEACQYLMFRPPLHDETRPQKVSWRRCAEAPNYSQNLYTVRNLSKPDEHPAFGRWDVSTVPPEWVQLTVQDHISHGTRVRLDPRKPHGFVHLLAGPPLINTLPCLLGESDKSTQKPSVNNNRGCVEFDILQRAILSTAFFL
nr:hypothetical protein CFP56_48815 [Quercus suber]